MMAGTESLSLRAFFQHRQAFLLAHEEVRLVKRLRPWALFHLEMTSPITCCLLSLFRG